MTSRRQSNQRVTLKTLSSARTAVANMKAKKYSESKGEGMEVEVMNPDLMAAVKQMQAAVKASSVKPMHYKIKACFYEEED